MATALEAGYDLGAIAVLLLALGLLLTVKGLVQSVAHVFDFSVFGYRPLHGAAVALENGAIGALDDAIKGVERSVAKFTSGLIDAFGLLIAVPLLLGLGVKAALTYLWDSALKPTIHSITNPIATTAAKALGIATAAENEIAQAIKGLGARIAAAEESAVATAKAYVATRLAALQQAIGGEIAAGVSEAERFAEQAVGKLRAAEDLAVAGAVAVAAEAKHAGQLAGAAALLAAEAEFGPEIAALRAAEAAGLAELDRVTKAALEGVKSIAVTAENEIGALVGDLDLSEAAALIASIPLLATLVHSIATEAGLENAECRKKVKGVCSTPTSAWDNLLKGLLGLGFLVSLPELAKIANGMADEVLPLVKRAA